MVPLPHRKLAVLQIHCVFEDSGSFPEYFGFIFMACKDTLPVLQPGKNKCSNNFLSFVKAEIGCHNAVGTTI